MNFNLENDDEIDAAEKKLNKIDRVVRVPIQLPMLVLFFMKDQVLKIDGLPSDSQFLGWTLDPERQDIIYLFVESKEFEEVTYGHLVPLWDGEINITKENYDMRELAKDLLGGGK